MSTTTERERKEVPPGADRGLAHTLHAAPTSISLLLDELSRIDSTDIERVEGAFSPVQDPQSVVATVSDPVAKALLATSYKIRGQSADLTIKSIFQNTGQEDRLNLSRKARYLETVSKLAMRMFWVEVLAQFPDLFDKHDQHDFEFRQGWRLEQKKQQRVGPDYLEAGAVETALDRLVASFARG